VLLVHVTRFNALMWDNGRTPVRVIEHGVRVPDGIAYTGELARGAVVVNGLRTRGRRLGADVFERVRAEVPLDIAGMGSEELGGEGDLPRERLAAFNARRRFFFNPIRYTSMGLAVCEAMMLGMPIIGLATTEMPTVIENGASGYVDTDVGRVISVMRDLLDDPAQARALGEGARRTAHERFGIERFAHDWDQTLRDVTGRRPAPTLAGSGNGATV
ncbi:MAG TPA: glycosyltransferase, partial [Dehalococcoidia bacterium]|nr:glycosyltransferase [Dehalococcoidia bacterium]